MVILPFAESEIEEKSMNGMISSETSNHTLPSSNSPQKQVLDYRISSSINEIEEEASDASISNNDDDGGRLGNIREDKFEISSDVVSLNGDDIVYVGVGKSESSMDALSWALKHAVNSSSTIVYLIHVFPVTRFVPYPLGKLPKDQASPEQLRSHLAQERGKRREFFQKFIHACSISKVKVDTVLIESDLTAKAIQDLIPVLNIRKLVLGISKSSARKLRGKKGNAVAEQVVRKSASENCEIKVICDGKEVMIEQIIELESPRCNDGDERDQHVTVKKDQSIDPFACCFNKPKTSR